MSLIKQGQLLMSEFIKSDIPKDDLKESTIYALNSGKRIRPLLAASLIGYDNMKHVIFIEYIHTGIGILSDMVNNREIRRRHPAVHVKWGHAIASQVACRLILRGLNFKQVQIPDELMANLKEPDWLSLPRREIIAELNLRCASLFSLARPDIGTHFGMCYTGDTDVFQEHMKQLLSKVKDAQDAQDDRWSPLLHELVKYLMARFKDKLKSQPVEN